MVGVLYSSFENRGFDSLSGNIQDYKIGIFCFSAKQAVLKSKIGNWLGLSRLIYTGLEPNENMPITNNVVSSNLAQAKCTRYNIM